MTGAEQNAKAMAAHGIAVGDVRGEGARVVRVIAPGEHWPRNGRGLVRCTVEWTGGGVSKAELTHYWPSTLAKYPLMGNPS